MSFSFGHAAYLTAFLLAWRSSQQYLRLYPRLDGSDNGRGLNPGSQSLVGWKIDWRWSSEATALTIFRCLRQLFYRAKNPPSMVSSLPVTNLAASLAR
jgi:hypothetical protein